MRPFLIFLFSFTSFLFFWIFVENIGPSSREIGKADEKLKGDCTSLCSVAPIETTLPVAIPSDSFFSLYYQHNIPWLRSGRSVLASAPLSS